MEGADFETKPSYFNKTIKKQQLANSKATYYRSYFKKASR